MPRGKGEELLVPSALCPQPPGLGSPALHQLHSGHPSLQGAAPSPRQAAAVGASWMPSVPMGVLQGLKPTYIQFQHFEETSPGRGEMTLQAAPSSCGGWSPSGCRRLLPTSVCHFWALTSSPSETSAPAGVAGPPPLLGAPGAAAWVPAAGGRVSWPGEALGRI